MNRAISKHGGTALDDFKESNCTGRFRRVTYGSDPFGNPKRKVWGYYVTAPGGLVARPPDGKNSFLTLLQDEMIGNHYSVARGVPEVIDLTTEMQSNPQQKGKQKKRS